MVDGPYQPFTANPSSDGTKSTVGKIGGKRSFSADANSPWFTAGDLPPVGPSFIMRVCRLDLGILVPRLAQARRARSPQIAQVRGALAVASGCPRMSVA